MITNEQVGRALRALRYLDGRNASQFAAIVGCSTGKLHHIERGSAVLSATALLYILDEFDLTPNEFLALGDPSCE